METIWTCPICGDECSDNHAERCSECWKSVHRSHVKDHKCSECRERLGLDRPQHSSIYVDEHRQLQLQLVSYEI